MWVTGDYIEASSGTLPAHSVGDLLVIVAVRWASTTPPSLPSGWSSPTSGATFSGAGASGRIGYKIATGTTAESSGTWTNANTLFVGIWDDMLSLAAAAGVFSATDAAQTPGLTMVGAGANWVATLGSPTDGAAGTPAGTVSRWFDGYSRWADTDGPVGSWPAQTVANQWLAVSAEMVPDINYADADVTTSWGVEAYADADVTTSWDIAGFTETDVETSWDVYTAAVADVTTSWRIEAFADADVTTSWQIESLAGWVEVRASERWELAVTDLERETSTRIVVVDLDHRPVSVLDQWGEPLGDFPLTAGEATMNGESDQAFSCQLTTTDPRWVPRTHLDPLHPLSPYRLAVFWRLKLGDGLWGEIPLGVVRTGRPKIDDSGTLTITVEGQDVLSVAKRGGYGGQVIPVGGMTVGQALERLFAIVAPTVPFRCEPSTVILPAVYELGRRKPSEDWTELAGMAGFVIRADREGTLTAGPQADPQAVTMRLVEGPRCPMVSISRELSDTVYNRVVVTGTNPDLTEPVFGIDEDSDETSPTWVGRFGPYELQIDSDAVESNVAATNLARMHRGRWRRPAESIKAWIRPRPDRDPRDLVEVVRRLSRVGGTYRLSSWRFPLPIPGQKPGDMEVEFMSEQAT